MNIDTTFITLIIIIVISMLIISYLIYYIYKVRKSITYMSVILDDIEAGNINRKLIAKHNDATSKICYKINKIIMAKNEQIIGLEKREQSYKQLMTSLSHDIKTPLTSLIGYLDAIQYDFVTGNEKDKYIEIALKKSYDLKDFIDILFEWLKLDSGELEFNFQLIDINELTRNIIIDWIPSLEQKAISYDIDIPNYELILPIDRNSYIRIINNLIQNIIIHSNANNIYIRISSKSDEVTINISDNGEGIPPDKLAFIFDRLYKCDDSRSSKGNGLGLSIVKNLVEANNGIIYVSSNPHSLTSFKIIIPINKHY